QDRRQRRDRAQVEGAGQGQPREDAVEVLGRGPPRAHAGDEAAVLLQVVGLVDRVEGDRRVEVGEDDDEEDLADDVGPAAGAEEGGEFERGGSVQQLADRRREGHDRGGEDDRDDAGHVDPQRQIGRTARGHFAPHHPFRVLDRDAALTLLDEDDRDDHRQRQERHHHDEDLIGVRPPGLQPGGQPGDDRGEDHQRDAVADAALGDQLAEPHQQRAPGRKRHHDQQHAAAAEVGDGVVGGGFATEGLEEVDVAEGLPEGEPDGEVARVLGDLLLADLAFFLQLLQRGHDHGQQLQDDRGGDVGHDPQREKRQAGEASTREEVKEAEDVGAAEVVL